MRHHNTISLLALSTLIAFLSFHANAGMSGSSDCQECQKADNSVQMLCTLETKDVKGPVDEDDRDRADQLRLRHQTAMNDGLLAQQNSSMPDRHGQIGAAGAAKANASRDSASSCRQARESAQKKCKNQCECRNCEKAESQAEKWDGQYAEDRRFADESFKIHEETYVKPEDRQPSAAAVRQNRERNIASPDTFKPFETVPGDHYPQNRNTPRQQPPRQGSPITYFGEGL